MKIIIVSESTIMEIERLFDDRIKDLQSKAHGATESFIQDAYRKREKTIRTAYIEFNTAVENEK